jgi:hypothetical protein
MGLQIKKSVNIACGNAIKNYQYGGVSTISVIL